MAKVFDSITDELQAFIAQQPMFFVATAPLSETGHVNMSPKGLDCLRVLSPNQVAYCDLTGSGNETSAHLQENGRITFMFCAFERAPLILRLYGYGKTVLPTMPEWQTLAACLPEIPGTRQIIVATIDRVQTSCGMGVPLMTLNEQRDDLLRWADKKGEQGLLDYWKQKNVISIDQMPTPLGAAISE
ncbi:MULTISPECIES: pyridoxamine 5'-phosphate oxidase family protein [unclassified Leptolyngbya]|uniref:pyridoxamine 5'-phosphate oxidase family protein n=1 Tax=unclassified Leptolyngbya TaxID=2650499 RepID=UPI0016868E81|nr:MULTISPECIES: pyridoxamine 5'-phosphate oxidase family protein [unclassified Leptolyngbya]MBD1912896.1 pyridoxamine 5'-phosphate oxidase family protein [Leptolyngbya sp. FACHB-8]MBD2154775.1 pyridoxamine 5'-phosphate oxidase family protein [Leptolyngbya sp. FACHB-16]